MVHYSILIPARDCAESLRAQIPRLTAELERLSLPFEILTIADGSTPETIAQFEAMQQADARVRVLRLETAVGASVALSAGMAAARGDILIAIEAGQRYPVEQIPHLVARLSRLDLVFARRRLGSWKKLWHRVQRIPRGLLLGLDVRHPECLFWAARREAVADITLAPGMRRYLPWLVAGRGFRVGDMYVKENPCDSTLHDPKPNPLDLLSAWWTCRRWRNDSAHELQPVATTNGLRLVRADAADSQPVLMGEGSASVPAPHTIPVRADGHRADPMHEAPLSKRA